MNEESEPVRIRVCVEDGHLLSAQQRKEGLRRCWLLLPPTAATVADLSDHLCRRFNLQKACPHGLILSMDGFVLPPFESTDIIQDKDIIRYRVRRRGVTVKDIIDVHDDEHANLGVELVEKSKSNGVKLLALREFQEESGGYRSGDETDSCAAHDDTVPAKTPVKKVANSKRKREQSTDSDNSRKKKQTRIKDKNINQKAKQNSQKSDTSEKILTKEKAHSECIEAGPSDTQTAGNDDGIPMSGGNEEGEIPNVGNLQRDAGDCPSATSMKIPSRSARRKKAKRIWLRERKRLEMLEHDQRQSLEKDSRRDLHDRSEGDQNNDHAEEELSTGALEQQHDTNNDNKVIPVVVRPGHIRFEPIEEHSIQNSEQHAELLRWTGTTSKKKGQKWGREKFSSRRNDDFVSNELPNGNISTEEAVPNETNFSKDSELVNGHVDFDKLVSFTSQPKEGDVIAYRLVELSSSWCPELSPFRVGRVSSYDAASAKVVLLPVDEFPIVPEEKNDEENLSCQQSVSLYNDDGSLEIDFASLVDVRQFKLKDLEPVTSATPEKPITSKETSQNEKEADAQTEGSRDAVWEQLRSALEEKKAQLSNSNASSAKHNRSDGSSSYRAIRASALGPTIALLRAQNDL